MSHRTFGAHLHRLSSAALNALEAGFYIPLALRSARGPLFSGAEELSTRELALSLAGLASRLRFRRAALQQRLRQVASVLVVHVRSGSWGLAYAAALELASLFRQATRWGHVNTELALRASNCALLIAYRCSREVR
jgi:hypothetical protein